MLRSPYKHVPMTSAQASRCNAALAPGAKSTPLHWLSPRQIELLGRIQKAPTRKWPIAVDVPILQAWAKLHG